jgi:hypothetical protein
MNVRQEYDDKENQAKFDNDTIKYQNMRFLITVWLLIYFSYYLVIHLPIHSYTFTCVYVSAHFRRYREFRELSFTGHALAEPVKRICLQPLNQH